MAGVWCVKIITAITGASGAIYGLRFLERAAQLGASIDLLLSAAGLRVIREELGFDPDPEHGALRDRLGDRHAQVRRVRIADIGAECASGSVAYDGMAVIPCSMGTAARIAAGISGNLIERAADVTLKERRPLVLVPRESPLNRIHLRTLLELHDAGAVILPAMPSFYHLPVTIDDLVDSVVDRTLAVFYGNDAIRNRWHPQGGRP